MTNLERGLKQRVTALNLFLKDIYTGGKIVQEGVVPSDFVYSSSGYLSACEGIIPPKGIFSHISGIDLVQAEDDWYILEDNLRIPSGASYPLIARNLCRRASLVTFQTNKVVDNNRYLAERTDSVLAESRDLFVENDVLWYQGMEQTYRVGAIYRRVSDEYLDPVTFLPDSLIGIPNLMAAYRAGNVAIINTPGNGVADDKGIYYFVPKMIKYYLDEEPILHNVPTYLPFYEEDRKYIFIPFLIYRARTRLLLAIRSGATLRVWRISSQTVVFLKKLPMVMGSQLNRNSQ